MVQPPFAEAATAPALLDAADVGPGRWQPRGELGALPLRFPHVEEPDDAGWHIVGSYTPPGQSAFFTNDPSSYRALLMLYLFTDVDESDAPTRIRVGSIMDIPRVLRRHGDDGASGSPLSPEVDAAARHRPVALAGGRAGDVFVGHPFPVHAAQPRHGTRPRVHRPAVPPSGERPPGAALRRQRRTDRANRPAGAQRRRT